MQSVLEELYSQRLESGKVMKSNKEYNRLVSEAGDIYEKLAQDGTEEQKSLLNKLWEAEAGQEDEASCTFFKEGFKACMLIISELNKLV